MRRACARSHRLASVADPYHTTPAPRLIAEPTHHDAKPATGSRRKKRENFKVFLTLVRHKEEGNDDT